jgi:hypothetical protein
MRSSRTSMHLPIKIPSKNNDKISKVYRYRLSPKLRYTLKTKGINEIISRKSHKHMINQHIGQWDTKLFTEDQSPILIQPQKYWFEYAKWYNASNRIKNKDLKTLFSDIGEIKSKRIIDAPKPFMSPTSNISYSSKKVQKCHTPRAPLMSKVLKPAFKKVVKEDKDLKFINFFINRVSHVNKNHTDHHKASKDKAKFDHRYKLNMHRRSIGKYN